MRIDAGGFQVGVAQGGTRSNGAAIRAHPTNQRIPFDLLSGLSLLALVRAASLKYFLLAIYCPRGRLMRCPQRSCAGSAGPQRYPLPLDGTALHVAAVRDVLPSWVWRAKE